MKVKLVLKGEGKGNWGHAGRPGEVGGSAASSEGTTQSWEAHTIDKVQAGLKDVMKSALPKGTVLAVSKYGGYTMYGIGILLKPTVTENDVKNVIGKFLADNHPGWMIDQIHIHNIIGKYDDVTYVHIQPNKPGSNTEVINYAR